MQAPEPADCVSADEVLKAWQAEQDPRRKEHLLQQLLAVYAQPLIEHVIRARVPLLEGLNGREGQDAQDLIQNVQAQLLQVMRKRGNTIVNFAAYVSTAARNVIYQLLRRMNREWYSMSNSVRYVLTHSIDLDLWRLEDTRDIGGFLAHKGRPPFGDLRDTDDERIRYQNEKRASGRVARMKVKLVHVARCIRDIGDERR